MKRCQSVKVRRVVIAASVAVIAVYAWIAGQRAAYPYDLDFIEDGLVMQAWRTAQGLPVFVPPNAEFVPHVYMPLYTWLGGLLMAGTGPGLAPLRLLSLCATAVAAAVMFWVARRESGANWIALGCAAAFLAGDWLTGGWYALARVDALFVALALLGAAAAIYGHASAKGLAAAGVALGLACLTKQNGIAFAAAATVYLAWVVRRRAAWFLAALGIVAGAPIILLNAASDGWFTTYTFGIAYASPIELPRAVSALGWGVAGSMTALVAAALVVSWRSLRRAGWRVWIEQPWLLFTAVAIAVSVAGRASVGGASNNLLPAYAFLCVSPALLMRELAAQPGNGVSSIRDIRRAEHLVAAVIAAQLVFTVVSPSSLAKDIRNPFELIPTPEMRAAGDRLIERIRSTPGEVLVMLHPYYAALAGKRPGGQIQALWHARWRGREPLPADLVERIERQYYAAIISDESPYFETEPALRILIDAHYRPAAALTESDAPATTSGLVTRPSTVYVPR